MGRSGCWAPIGASRLASPKKVNRYENWAPLNAYLEHVRTVTTINKGPAACLPIWSEAYGRGGGAKR